MDTKSIWHLVAGLIIGFIIGALAVDKGIILQKTVLDEEGDTMVATSTVTKTTSLDKETTGVVLPGTNTLDVADQTSGMLVTISTVTLNEQGWVAIHEDSDGNPGRILGAALVFAGERNNVPVELLRATEAGKTYYAMLHADDGDKSFDIGKDLPIKDSSGNVVMVKFTAK